MTDLSFSLARWWPLLLWPLAMAWAWWSQRDSQPKPPVRVGQALLALRLLVWTLLLLLLCGPRLAWNEVQRKPATLAVLLDNSASMRHLEGRLDHGDWLPALEEALPEVRVRRFAYDGKLRELKGTEGNALPGDGVETDLDAALAGVERAMTGEHWAGLLVVGDGNVTRGAWPLERAEALPARIWTAGTGRRNPAVDAMVRQLEVNRQVRRGQAQPVEVELESRGMAGRKAQLLLMEDGVERASVEVVLGEDGGRRRIPLTWTAQRAGPRVLEAVLRVEGGGERTLENNRRAVQVRVEEGRTSVLLLAGRPSEDLAFLRQVLEAREDVELLFAMPERPGADLAALRRAVEGAELLVLAHWPLTGRGNPQLQTLVATRAGRVPTLVLDGPGVDLGLLHKDLARGAGPWQSGTEGAARLPGLDPLLGPEESLGELRSLYDEMPPLRATRPGLGKRGMHGSRVLVESAEGHPLILLQERAGHRQGWLLLQGLWRWGVGSQLSLGHNRRAFELTDRLAGWLLATPGRGLLEVRPDRESLPAGASLAFDARLREEDGRPREGASVHMWLRSDSLKEELELEGLGGGAYRGSLQALAPGTWMWRAEARQGDRAPVADSGRVLVELRSPESLDASRHPRLLMELASAGGGRALDLDDAADRLRLANGSALDSLEKRPLLRRVARQRDLAAEGWILALLILLLGGEWIWRRLHGLL